MKTIELNLNKSEKAIIKVLKNYNEHDLMDNIGMARKEFIKLRKQLEDCIIIKQPVKNIK